MFVVLLTYVKPLAEVEKYTPDHRSFLDRQYAAGHFLLSGRQNPPQGGVIIARSPDRAHLEALLQDDPFNTEGIAEYQILEFTPTKYQPFLQPFIEAL